MSVVVTRSVRCHFNSPAQQGQRMFVTGTSTGSAPAAAGGASRRWKGPCPGFRPGRLGWALRLPLENGVADRALLRRSFPSFFTSSRNRSFSVWTRVNSSRRDWFSSSKSSIRWCSPSGSGPVIQTTVTDPARNVQRFLFSGQSATTQPTRQCRESGTQPPALPDQHRWIPALPERDYDDTQRPLRLRATHQGLHAGPRRPAPVQPSRRDARGEGPVMGNPDPTKICTSYVERQNLTIRMQMRRLTRLTNAFSKKWENLWAAYCLHFAYYNFCRIHKTIRVTPAMEAGITSRVWTIAELLA